MLNRLILTAQVVERGAMRYTPAGLPVLDLGLKHESEILHNGQVRRVALEIKARGIGEITQNLGRLEIGSSHGFAGFLGPQRNGRGVVFHVTELDSTIEPGPGL
ncbi:MAG: primosomal replication protein N [Pseudomonadota bacterium]